MKKRIIALAAAGILAAAAFAGCGSSDGNAATSASSAKEDSAVTSEASASSDASAEGASYNLIANTWGVGAYPLDEIQGWSEYAAKVAGCTLDTANNEFTADKIVSQLESQLAANPDGANLCLVIGSAFEPCMDALENAGVPYVWNSNFPSDEELYNRCLESSLFAGGVNPDPYQQGAQMAETAIADGCKSAIITAAAIGDWSHDNRILGFTETFEAAGGKVLQVSHSTDPSEAVQKTNDLLSAQPDADCIYGCGGDYLIAAQSDLETRTDVNQDMKIYGTDIDPTLVPMIKEGKVAGMNGSLGVQGSLAECLLINLLDGHPILDADGKPVMFMNLQCAVITTDNADVYQAGFDANVSWVGDDNYKSLLYRYNPDVTIDTFNEVFENFAQISYDQAASCQ